MKLPCDEAHPTLSFVERTRLLANQWKTFTNQQKQPYQTKANVDALRSKKEFVFWNETMKSIKKKATK